MANPRSLEPPMSAATPLDAPTAPGAVPAAMEQLARLALVATRADGALVLLFGADRRGFVAGKLVPSWMSHDSGILLRAGVVARAAEHGGCVLPGLAVPPHEEDDALLRALGVGGLLVAAMVRDDGLVLGAVVVVTRQAAAWSVESVSALQDVAALATSTVQAHGALEVRGDRGARHRLDDTRDALTGLSNRSAFLQRVRDAVTRAAAGDHTLFAVVFVDIDDFRSVNDALGHEAANGILVEVARRLEGCVRGGDAVARLGGDEFAILLERVSDAREAARVASRVHAALQQPLVSGDSEWQATASLGVALSGGASEARAPESLLRCADLAMFRAKHQGRGRVEIYDRGQHAHAIGRLQVESDLRRALERDEFELHYQPIVRLADGEPGLAGVEALVRWRHPERGLLLPDHFIPVAEESGMIVQLGRWVMRRAIAEISAWEGRTGATGALTLAINLSAREFAQVDLVRAIADALAAGRMAPGRLHVELTESALFSQEHVAMETVGALKELGVRIHIDDFGTGYSSLSHLQRLPVDAIKIDRSFVRGIELEARSRHVVSSLVRLATGIGLDVVAEGVANSGQVGLLQRMGCDFAQGYHFGRPVPAADALRHAVQRLALPAWRLSMS